MIGSLVSSDDRPAEGSAPRVFHHHKASDEISLVGQHYRDGFPSPPPKLHLQLTKRVVSLHGVRKETCYICRPLGLDLVHVRRDQCSVWFRVSRSFTREFTLVRCSLECRPMQSRC